MRLTKLKLAGFKSFVDPTTIALPGQLVGVVGPNGCGKSNVMDAVRWVLGESKASELRGESMQDVIFNGSSNRKPVARAAVELVFDNSLGRAAGQWSQYAELSVKRLLTRTGQSEYYINNLQVRRKDITDLFLGTGLGPRAYAIIGQGMISRIIEAKPDELRVFLEEAAGVTRYKERRKETENRIADTRDNLTRIEDIRVELSAQMERLEAQAAVARRYHEYNNELTKKQQLLWLLKRNEAQAERERAARDVERASNDLEGQTAGLREVEARLEAAREQHFGSSDGVHNAQSELFAANAEVARLETELRHRREAQQDLEQRVAQLNAERQQWQAQAEKADGDERRWRELGELADERCEEAAMRLEAQQERLPLVEEAQAAAQEALNAQRAAVAEAEQKLRVEEAHRANAERTLFNLGGRRERLEQEAAALVKPDEAEIELKEAEHESLQEDVAAAQERVMAAQQALPELDARRREVQQDLQRAQQAKGEAEARRNALEQLQKRMQSGSKIGEWLQRHGLSSRTPLWKRLHVEAGWEDALEAVLRERLSAVDAGDADLAAWAKDRPGAKVTVLLPGGGDGAASNGDNLLARVRCDDPAIAGPLADWLRGVRSIADLPAALARRGELAAGEVWVTPGGDLVGRHSVTLFAADAAEHGFLERQREIESLQSLIDERQQAVEAQEARIAEVDERLEAARGEVEAARRQLEARQERAHAVQLEVLKLTQIMERYQDRMAQINEALREFQGEEEAERERMLVAEEAIVVQRETVAERQLALNEAKGRLEAAERTLRDEREQVAVAERELREAQFSQRECASKLEEIAGGRELAKRQLARVAEDLARCAESSGNLDPEEIVPKLQEALEQRVLREQALAGMRDALEAATAGLRGLEEERLKIEQGLNPLRDRIGELRLKEQAAALNVEQLALLLVEAEADEAALAADLPGARPGPLQGQITSLQRQIEALGAVNLAALEELESAKERKGYLDAQAADLGEALETLENAIRRIDRETRELLQTTYDTVNRHFGELFPTLFGGGEAKLIMTGDEILDSGVQVMAQPPGKKNSTIHLLSGGEKALTAIALVFSMFQLNPAPFCLLDEVDAPLDDTNTERFANMVRRMSTNTQFLFISHNKIAMEMAEQLVGVTMQESGVSRIVEVDIEEALRMREQVAA
ncbi:chromosome segregation protein SMC [Azospira restricta]|uniref:Chromosome partition protein Smc n=1 Tax=Azospira restricta TaxID=404405 RepID=A0A974PWC9_9RHOO|nr:chromosome segregation protein SMC [Azospira restricta]QRJ62697.1 chromosome segregation protein SMC [Azospira restricta]